MITGLRLGIGCWNTCLVRWCVELLDTLRAAHMTATATDRNIG